MSVTVLHRTKPKARKEHQCSTCYRIIKPGEAYDRQDNVFDGSRYTYLNCEHCQAMSARVLKLDIPSWWYDDGMSSEIIDEAFLEQSKTPADLRALVWFRRRWTRTDGSVVPVPVFASGGE